MTTLEALAPDLRAAHGARYEKYAVLPQEVLQTYREFPDCAIQLDRLTGGVRELLEPLRSFGQGSWSCLEANLAASYFVDRWFQDHPDRADQLTVVVPIAIGFVSVRLRRGMYGDVYEQNDGGKTLRHATARLPEFLRSTMRLAALIGIHHSSPYLEIPDVRWFYGCGDGVSAHLSDNIRGATRKKAAAKFGERWDWELHLLASAAHQGWHVFVDLDERSEGALWVALREDFKDVRRLLEPQAAYEAMLMHYLGGERSAFDFRPYAESQSIW